MRDVLRGERRKVERRAGRTVVDPHRPLQLAGDADARHALEREGLAPLVQKNLAVLELQSAEILWQLSVVERNRRLRL